MGRSHTAIARALKRNTGNHGYRYQQATQFAQQRHQDKPKAIKLTAEVQAYAIDKLASGWSPELICGRLALDQKIRLHHETLYRWLLECATLNVIKY